MGTHRYEIKVVGAKRAAKFAAELVRQGIMFEATDYGEPGVFTFVLRDA